MHRSYALSRPLFIHVYFFFFKQKTAYEMRISDWSSDVCSSDLLLLANSAFSCPDYLTTSRLCRSRYPTMCSPSSASARKRQSAAHGICQLQSRDSQSFADARCSRSFVEPKIRKYTMGKKIVRASWRERVCH